MAHIKKKKKKKKDTTQCPTLQVPYAKNLFLHLK